MYLKDFTRIDKTISQMARLIDEIPKDMKSKTFFQPNRSLHELLSHFLRQIEDTLNGEGEDESGW